MVKKLIQYALFVFAAIAIAGFYGIAHNQVTYTISSEYFTHFKFLQFQLPDYYIHPERLGASIVGWGATWWFGFIIGFVLGGLWIWDNKLTLRDRCQALKTVFLIVISFGIVGTIFAYLYYRPERYFEVFSFSGYGKQIEDSLHSMSDPYSFLKAGMIHSFSYLGGIVGLVFGVFRLWKLRSRSLD